MPFLHRNSGITHVISRKEYLQHSVIFSYILLLGTTLFNFLQTTNQIIILNYSNKVTYHILVVWFLTISCVIKGFSFMLGKSSSAFQCFLYFYLDLYANTILTMQMNEWRLAIPTFLIYI